ncbi:MAG: ATP-binding protein [Pseudomonadota bacterium]
MSIQPGRSLRWRLFLLAAGGLLPLALAVAGAVAYLVQERRIDTQGSALELARALATATEAQHRAAIGVLQSVAESEDLQPDRLPAFQRLARRVALQQGWRSVVVADPEGRILVNSSVPLGSTEGTPVDAGSMRRAIATLQPVVGEVAEGRFGRGPAFAVRVPVLRDGRLAYVLSAVVPVEQVQGIITRQDIPSSSVVGIFDATGNRVVRSRANAQARASPSLQALMAAPGREGMGPTYTLEGEPSYTGFHRLALSGWAVAVGISAREADQRVVGLLGAVLLGLLASLALSVAVARYFGRQVSQPIDQLKSAAAALGMGQPVQVPPLGVAELDEVGAALNLASAERERAARERHEAELEREALLARVTRALQEAEEAGRGKDEFLAMLGHELRNPLAPIATALHLMERKGDARTSHERAIVQRHLAHVTRLVDDLLDVSRITRKRLAMRFAPVRLLAVAEQAVQAMQGLGPALDRRVLRLELSPEGADLWVSADEARLAQVLGNLLGNAIKFTGPQGSITVRLRRDGDAAEIEVADDGVGMTQAVLEHVFDLFYQAPQGVDRALGGLGLGLALVRSLVEMHGGTVQARSAGPNRGSSLTVRLPAIAAPARAEPAPAASPAPAAMPKAGGVRVLVVDDNHDAADTAATLLEFSGYEVRTAYEPWAAIDMFRQFRPEVALLDIGLPGMNGYELAARLRAQPTGAQCKLIALTGYGTRSDVARALQVGFDAHMTKPAAPDMLLDEVARLSGAGRADLEKNET